MKASLLRESYAIVTVDRRRPPPRYDRLRCGSTRWHNIRGLLVEKSSWKSMNI
jgi:hypothetical protein